MPWTFSDVTSVVFAVGPPMVLLAFVWGPAERGESDAAVALAEVALLDVLQRSSSSRRRRTAQGKVWCAC